MSQKPLTPEPGTSPRAVPPAWFDLAARIDAARAVAGCVTESLPVCLERMNPLQQAAINRAGALSGAVSDLLDLIAHDAETLEAQLLGSAS